MLSLLIRPIGRYYGGLVASEPYEALLIEKAVGKAPGELMGDYVKSYPVKGSQ